MKGKRKTENMTDLDVDDTLAYYSKQLARYSIEVQEKFISLKSEIANITKEKVSLSKELDTLILSNNRIVHERDAISQKYQDMKDDRDIYKNSLDEKLKKEKEFWNHKEICKEILKCD